MIPPLLGRSSSGKLPARGSCLADDAIAVIGDRRLPGRDAVDGFRQRHRKTFAVGTVDDAGGRRAMPRI